MEFSQLTNEIVRDSNESLHVDFQGEGEQLVICFGAYDSERTPPFEFYGRMKKLEKLAGRKLNKLLIRDVSNSWYHYGLRDRGWAIPETIARLKDLIAQLKPSKVIAIGQSMGAFGAVMYGALLNVDSVIGFGPLAVFDSKVSYIYSDDRWSDVVKRVEADPPEQFHQNLPQLIDSLNGQTCFHIYYGTKPTDDPADKTKFVEAVNYDAVQGLLYSQCPSVVPHPVRWSVHRVPAYLREVDFLDEMLLFRIFGIDYCEESFEDLPIDPKLADWMERSYEKGFDAAVLLPQVRYEFPTMADDIKTAFDRARRNVLRRWM